MLSRAAASRVLEKSSHTIPGFSRVVTIERFRAAPSGPAVHVTGLKDDVNKDLIAMCFENLAPDCELNVEFESSIGEAILTFDTPDSKYE